MSQDKNILEKTLIKALYLHDDAEVEKILSEKKLQVDYEDELSGKRLLIHAIEQGNARATQKLLERGANVNFRKGEEGVTPLQAAIRSDQIVLVKLLFTWGADIRVGCDYPYSHFHEAAYRGNVEIVKLCYEYGAKDDINAKNKYHQTALDLVFEGTADPKVIQFLHFKGAKRSVRHPFDKSVEYCEFIIAFLSELAATGKIVNSKMAAYGRFQFNGEKLSVLTGAVRLGHWKFAKLLYENGFRNHYSSSNEGTKCYSLLHYAGIGCALGSAQTIAWVLSVPELWKKADLNQFTSSFMGVTPLGFNATIGSESGLKFFMERGPKLGMIVNLKNSRDCNVVHAAYMASAPRIERAYLLQDLGANSDLVEPYPSGFEEYHIIAHENYKLMQTCIGDKEYKLLVTYIEAEYYKRSKDIFRNKNPKLLKNLIQIFAKHAKKVLFEKNRASIQERLLQRLNVVGAAADSLVLENNINAAMKKIEGMLEESLINRLEAIFFEAGLPRTSLDAMQPYLSFELSQYEADEIRKKRDLQKKNQQQGNKERKQCEEPNQTKDALVKILKPLRSFINMSQGMMDSTVFHAMINSYLGLGEGAVLHSMGCTNGGKTGNKTITSVSGARNKTEITDSIGEFECSLHYAFGQNFGEEGRNSSSYRALEYLVTKHEPKPSTVDSKAAIEATKVLGLENDSLDSKEAMDLISIFRASFLEQMKKLIAARSQFSIKLMIKYRDAKNKKTTVDAATVDGASGAVVLANTAVDATGLEIKLQTESKGSSEPLNSQIANREAREASPVSRQVLDQPISNDTDKSLVRFFRCFEQGQGQTPEVLELRDRIVRGFNRDNLRQASLFLLETVGLPPMDPMPMLSAYRQKMGQSNTVSVSLVVSADGQPSKPVQKDEVQGKSKP